MFLFSPLFLPIVLIVAVLVRKKIGSPIFFFQIRPGLKGQQFKMVKFRTMNDDCDEEGKLYCQIQCV